MAVDKYFGKKPHRHAIRYFPGVRKESMDALREWIAETEERFAKWEDDGR
jgi:hypothetical protein